MGKLENSAIQKATDNLNANITTPLGLPLFKFVAGKDDVKPSIHLPYKFEHSLALNEITKLLKAQGIHIITSSNPMHAKIEISSPQDLAAIEKMSEDGKKITAEIQQAIEDRKNLDQFNSATGSQIRKTSTAAAMSMMSSSSPTVTKTESIAPSVAPASSTPKFEPVSKVLPINNIPDILNQNIAEVAFKRSAFQYDEKLSKEMKQPIFSLKLNPDEIDKPEKAATFLKRKGIDAEYDNFGYEDYKLIIKISSDQDFDKIKQINADSLERAVFPADFLGKLMLNAINRHLESKKQLHFEKGELHLYDQKKKEITEESKDLNKLDEGARRDYVWAQVISSILQDDKMNDKEKENKLWLVNIAILSSNSKELKAGLSSDLMKEYATLRQNGNSYSGSINYSKLTEHIFMKSNLKANAEQVNDLHKVDSICVKDRSKKIDEAVRDAAQSIDEIISPANSKANTATQITYSGGAPRIH